MQVCQCVMQPCACVCIRAMWPCTCACFHAIQARMCHVGVCICACMARDMTWQHSEQWLCVMAMHVHVQACGKRWLCLPFLLVTTCPCIMHVMVLCVRTYGHYMHILLCRWGCGSIHGSWICVPPIISVFIPGCTWARAPSCMCMDTLRGMHLNRPGPWA